MGGGSGARKAAGRHWVDAAQKIIKGTSGVITAGGVRWLGDVLVVKSLWGSEKQHSQ